MAYQEDFENMQQARRLVEQMIEFVDAFWIGKISGPVDFRYDLSAQEVNDLKAAFASARSACKAALDGVTGQP